MSAVITPYGVQADSYSEIIENLRNDFRRIYGESIELEPNTPDGQIIGIYSQMASDLTELIKNLFASLFPSTAEGVFLDGNLDLIGLKRGVGRAAEVNLNVEFDGVQDIAPWDFEVIIQNNVFANQEEIRTAGIYRFKSLEEMSMQFTPDEPVSVSKPIDGVSVSFASVASGGADFESDFDFRSKWRDLVETKDHSANHIKGRLNQIDGVDDCAVYETDSSPYDGLPPNCIYAVVKPGYFNNETVLNTLYALKPPGIRSYYTNTEPSQNKAFGNGEIRVGFDFAEYMEIPNYVFRFSSKSRIAEIDSDDVLTVLKSMRFKIGESVFASDVNNFVISKMPDWFADSGNSINGQDFLQGRTGVIYEF